jgi:RNA polymerase sigma factor (sigma-70 family)
MTGDVLPAIDDRLAEDQALLVRLRAGEDSAFGELFSRHSSAVYRLALGLANDRSEADDLTAEAFFRVLQAIRRGSGPVDNVRGYLLIVARRVAWEWSMRRRDVPVSDEELTHRTPASFDTVGALPERNLIRRAFRSLPERWRKVLWKMEVEGERPAVVAINFGLSPNATAALARRARQGLRAAYLQAHLASENAATACRSVLEKLGAYTAGSTSGIERRRIHAHLASCASCTTVHAELRDVCAGLRAHAGMSAVPVVAVAGWQLGAALKGLFASAKVQIGLAATSAAAVGVLGFVVGPWGASDDDTALPVDLDGRRIVEMEIGKGQPVPPSSVEVNSGSGTSAVEGTTSEEAERQEPEPVQDPEPPVVPVVPTSSPPAGDRSEPVEEGTPAAESGENAETYDESAPVKYRETTVERYTEQYGTYTLIYETTTVKEINSLDQTRTTTTTTSYTQPAPAPE